MNPLFWLTLLVATFTAYKVGHFVTFRNLRLAADELMAKAEADNKRWKAAQEKMAAKIATQAIEDNATGSPIGAGLAREMGIEL